MPKMPHSIEAEKGLIGSVLLEPKKLHNVSVMPYEFYDDRHKVLWKAINKHDSEHYEWDSITLSEHLKGEGDIERVGGFDYILSLMSDYINTHYVQSYAREVKEKYELREEINILETNLKTAYKGESVSDNVIAKLMRGDIDTHHDYKLIVEDWKKAKEGKRSTIPTPYVAIDRITGGIRQGMVTIFTGRSKSGKSMMLAHWYNYLGQNNIPTLAVPLEDKYDITIKRMAANLGNYDASVLDAGGRFVNVNDEWVWDAVKDRMIENAEQCLDHVSKYPIYFHDRKVTPAQLRGIAIRYKRKHDIQVMFIDGAKDLLRPSGKYNDVGMDEEISQTLCSIAEELNIAVVSVHHLTKINEEERITVNHIRGSGNIVGDSRAVYALQSSGIGGLLVEQGYELDYDENGRIKNRIFECLVNNHGGTASKPLTTDLNKCQFTEIKRHKS